MKVYNITWKTLTISKTEKTVMAEDIKIAIKKLENHVFKDFSEPVEIVDIITLMKIDII